MLSDKLLDELSQLPPAEKLRVVQILVNDLAAVADKEPFLSRHQYEIWSPYDAPGAAEILLQMLEDEKNNSDA